jgi:hypothetical protein
MSNRLHQEHEKAVISPLGNKRRCFPPRCELDSDRCVNRFEMDKRAQIGTRIFPQTREHIMNRPERTFATRQIRLERRLPSYWRVTFDIPPVNIFGPKQLPQLNGIITAIEKDEQVKVVVFDSAVDGFFVTRLVDVASLPSDAEIKPEWEAFIAALGRPASQKRIKALMARGFHRAGDVENRLGFHVGQLGD